MQVVVFGATGVTGRAAVEHFASLDGWSVIGVSRRAVDVAGVAHVALDLTDAAACRDVLGGERFARTTHVVYAALQEHDDMVAGWQDPVTMARNDAMLAHALEPLCGRAGPMLQHVALLQGGKAYGVHLGRMPIPAKERSPRDDHANFYFLQEDRLRSLAAAHGFAWTILRPQVIFGHSFASPMNLLPAIGAYAAITRAAGDAFSFPGGDPAVHEAVDARLLARVLAWAATTEAARGEIFNVTNGDVYDWHSVWPVIADALGVEAGPHRPQRLAETMPGRAPEWAAVVDRHGLRSPRDLASFVGASWTYADMLFGTPGARRPVPSLMSTVKLRQAGFAGCIDTEDMFRDWFAIFQARGLLPPR